jgi:cytochrome c6
LLRFARNDVWNIQRCARWALLTCAFALASPALADSEDQGRDIYGEMCAQCHGRDMVNPGGVVFDLRKFPPDQFDRFKTSVLNGKGQAMPPWRDKLSDEDVTDLWAYVKTGGK